MSESIDIRPLAARMRPASIDEVLGQDHLLASGKPLRRMIASGRLRSMIFWGPPGVGKTSIALLLADAIGADFHRLSAVSAGIKDVREVIERGRLLQQQGKPLVLFLDEIHRFNKAQQDALLPAVEEGWIVLIGATTENPSFEVIRPLLSRTSLFTLQPLSDKDLLDLIERARTIDTRLASLRIEDTDLLLRLSGGDARRLLTGLDVALDLIDTDEKILSTERITQAFNSRGFYDKTGDAHYDIISAFIKSIRGSDPDGALYWAARMIESGEDPLFIARRMVVLASEDIGNADPYAITLATQVYQAVERIGMPEGRIILAQGVTYLATAPKSNATYMAIEAALADARAHPNLFPPLHIRNAPTGLMKSLGYGKGYRYAHDFEEGFVRQDYLPPDLADRVYYHPTSFGREQKIGERLRELWPDRKRSAEKRGKEG